MLWRVSERSGAYVRAVLDDGADEACRRSDLSGGYVQSVQYDEILSWAVKHDAVVRFNFRPGDFVVDGDRKLAVHPSPKTWWPPTRDATPGRPTPVV